MRVALDQQRASAGQPIGRPSSDTTAAAAMDRFCASVTPRSRADAWSNARAVKEPLAVLAAGLRLEVSHRDGDSLVARPTSPELGERTVYLRCRDLVALP
jgi:hypothetical protein